MIFVIFNPTARGDKARQLREQLADLGSDVRCLPTRSAGDAIELAAEAVDLGAETVVAAGGDGTVNEVANGLAKAADGLTRCRLGVLPLGTVNVFAKELGLPANLKAAWQVIRAGHERTVDLPVAEYQAGGETQRRCFVQLAGAGLDSRAISLVDWEAKKKLGPLAYVLAGLRALREPASSVELSVNGQRLTGELVLIGNGRYYGGRYSCFPSARLDDGQLHATVFHRLNWLVLARTAIQLAAGRLADSSAVRLVQAKEFSLAAASPTPLQIEGDVVGELPAHFFLRPRVLRVVCP